jgi:tRNA-dihydrouridine synthase
MSRALSDSKAQESAAKECAPMTLWLRRTGLASPVDADRADYLVIEHDKVIGRINEERYVPADVRWFWSITEHVDPALGIITNGRVPSLEEAKERFESSWSKVREAQGQQRPE